VKPSTDADAIWNILLNDEVWDGVSDDKTPKHKVDLPAHYHYLLSDDADGVVMFYPRNSVEVEIHVAILPEAKHRSYYYIKRAINYLFNNSQYEKITAIIPFTNMGVYRMALQLGFQTEGINRMSFLKHGTLHDQWLVGLTREDWTCLSHYH
jgi:RimJ/RimL family protein N-acetyltransferase